MIILKRCWCKKLGRYNPTISKIKLDIYSIFCYAYVQIGINLNIFFCWEHIGGLGGRLLWCRGQREIWATDGIHRDTPFLGCYRVRRKNRRGRRVSPCNGGYQVGDWLFHQSSHTTKCSMGRGISAHFIQL